MDVPQSLYRSLTRLVAFTLSCGVLSAAGFAILYSLPRPAAGPGFWVLFSGVVVLSLGGMILMFFTASRLKDAVQNERWPQQSVDLWRSRTRSSWWRATVWLMLLFMFVAMVAGDRHRGFIHGYMFIYWPFFVTLQTLGQIGAAFSKPASSGSSGSSPIWRDWQNFGELKSDHWGQH